MITWFVLTVFGKVVFTVGPMTPPICDFMLHIYEPPTLDDVIIADGKILKPSDYRPWCVVSRYPPPLGTFDRGQPT